jgi:hypothetical protein
MKLIRKVILALSLGLTMLFHGCNPAIAREGTGASELGGYEYTMDDGVLTFAMSPCGIQGIVAIAPPSIKLKAAVATETASGATVPFCWYEQADAIVLVGPRGPFNRISLTDPRLSRRSKI